MLLTACLIVLGSLVLRDQTGAYADERKHVSASCKSAPAMEGDTVKIVFTFSQQIGFTSDSVLLYLRRGNESKNIFECDGLSPGQTNCTANDNRFLSLDLDDNTLSVRIPNATRDIQGIYELKGFINGVTYTPTSCNVTVSIAAVKEMLSNVSTSASKEPPEDPGVPVVTIIVVVIVVSCIILVVVVVAIIVFLRRRAPERLAGFQFLSCRKRAQDIKTNHDGDMLQSQMENGNDPTQTTGPASANKCLSEETGPLIDSSKVHTQGFEEDGTHSVPDINRKAKLERQSRVCMDE